MNIDPERLKKFIVDAGLMSGKDFDKVKKQSEKAGKPVEDVLIEQGIIDQEKLGKFKAYLLGVPFIEVGQEVIPPEVLSMIPEQIARAHNIIAFKRTGNNLEVAMLDPDDLTTIESIKKTNPMLKVLPRLTTPQAIKNTLMQYQSLESFGPGSVTMPAIPEFGGEFGDVLKSDLLKASQEVSIIKVVDTMMKHAIYQRASDIHIEPLETDVVVRFRVDGVLSDIMFLPLSTASALVARIKVLSNLKLDEHRLPQDGRFKVETEDYKYSVRVSVLPVFNGEKIVMRLLQEDMKVQTLESLGFYGRALEIVMNNLKRPIGMVLITGPTGSGKTTTLYSMMEILNTPSVNISTIEDPIEYRMPRINQTQVNAKIGLTFASGLRALVRQDPNIIMVGEIRDNETASLAINAALTGHLVLSTLHTTSAAGAIPRLIDMDVEPFLITSTINVIMAQRLVRKFHSDKEKYFLNKEDVENLKKYCDMKRVIHLMQEEKLLKKGDEDLTKAPFYRPKPSKDSKTGYRGRLAIVEVLAITEEIKRLIVKKASTADIATEAITEGMRTMFEDGLIKATQGLTSLEEVLRVIND
jgi:type IV pilus assembly protein PilB